MYTTKGKVQNYLGVDISASLDSQVDDWITAVEQWIENYVGTVFDASSETTRYYDGNGRTSLEIDSIVSTPSEVSLLDTDGDVDTTLTEGQGEDYLLYPLNETEKNEIRLTLNSSIGCFPSRERCLKVTAQFGKSSSVPKDIELVATKLVASIVDKGLKGGKLQSVSVGDVQSVFVQIDEEAEALGIYNVLDQYRDIEI